MNIDDTLKKDESLVRNQMLTSRNGRITLEMSDNGNLMLRQRTDILFESQTFGIGNRLLLTDQGLAVYDKNDLALWTPPINGISSMNLTVKDDGKLLWYDTRGFIIWSFNVSIGTRDNGIFLLLFLFLLIYYI